MSKEKNFFHSIKPDKDGNLWGVKGLQEGVHLTHKLGSNEFHVTTPIRIGKDIGTVKIRDYFDTEGNYKETKVGVTKKE